ncbi:MAG: cobyric acid synthase [Armatimonadota bacterium]
MSRDGIRRKKRPAVMFQGTGSNVGKSVLTAAFCRILRQDGYRVAPFKAQNMSLNSYAADGGEMGRAQVVQAQACGIGPDVRMNPILVKPTTETGSQVIVMGKPARTVDFREQMDHFAEAREIAFSAYDSLSSEYDVLVLEGAGSPAEVNLKDIVNMETARHAEAPVLLVGDIDRGGVFASFVGHMEVMTEWKRRLVAGFVINRFRGIKALLDPAIEFTERFTGLPTLGVVPHIPDLGIPDEDSVTWKSFFASEGDGVEVAVIDLPHISNFTDFDALRAESDVRLRAVRSASELGRPDAVVLPGSKNVLHDLSWLRETGLADAVMRSDAEVIGICGGYQMLGIKISDPHGIEGGGETSGLGLLPVETVLEREKTLRQVEGMHPCGLPITGYEIHHGVTEAGLVCEDGRAWGTYLHGVFDSDVFRRWFIDKLRAGRGLPPGEASAFDIEPALDRLAGIVRESLDVGAIYARMGL